MTPPGDRRRRIRLVLVRHGESGWNAAGLLQGHRGPGLTARGLAQAVATADLLAREYPDAALILRSDLPRVVETAAPAEERLGCPVRVDPRLREIDVGTWSGKTWAQIGAEDPRTLARWRRGEDIPRGGGETYAQLRARVWAALREAAAAVGADAPSARPSVLVFTHGGPVRVAVAAALGLPEGGWRALASVDNCSVSVIDVAADSRSNRLTSRNARALADGPVAPNGRVPPARLRAYNRVGHLAGYRVGEALTDAPG